jgi:hypothetical protein
VFGWALALRVKLATTTFDLAPLAKELDSNSRPARISTIAVPAFMVGLLAVFVAVLAPRVEAGSLSYLGWYGLLVIAGATVLLLVMARHMFWGARRAAVAVSVRPEGLELVYPEGRVSHLLWSDPRLQFQLDDLTDVPQSRKVLSTNYIVTEKTRTSALSNDAYTAILAEARANAVVTRAPIRRNLLNPWLFSPCTWSVEGRRGARDPPDS